MKFLQGNCLDKITELEDNSIDCVVSSPPYFNLRDYQVEEQFGLEKTYQDYIANTVKVFETFKTKLKETATIWWNVGDSYKDKNLLMIPNRVAIALQMAGWYIRSEIIWHKPNPMPESTKDRPTSAHEKIWLITKNKKYYYDADAIKEPFAQGTHLRYHNQKDILKNQKGSFVAHAGKKSNGAMKPVISGVKRNKRNVWTVTAKPFKDAHFATFPKDLIEPCIKAGCPEKVCVKCGKPQVKELYRDVETKEVHRNVRKGNGDRAIGGQYTKWMQENPYKIRIKPSCDCNADFKPGVVLDPFGGAGTTGIVAKSLNRQAILIELNPEYIEIAQNRMNKEFGMFL